jgi:hypothetical protein
MEWAWKDSCAATIYFLIGIFLIIGGISVLKDLPMSAETPDIIPQMAVLMLLVGVICVAIPLLEIISRLIKKIKK